MCIREFITSTLRSAGAQLPEELASYEHDAPPEQRQESQVSHCRLNG